MSSNNWNEYLIEDISEVVFSGGTPSTQKEEYWGGEYNWLSSGETRNTFITNTEKTITEAGVKNSSTKLAKKNDIVIASAGQGNTRGQVSLCKIDTFINQSIIAIRTNNKLVNPVYVFYNLKSRYKELRQISDGHSIRGSLTTKIINKMKINLPPIKDQNNLANILSSFDEKIEINNEINKKLEEMAQAIFKHWFVDFEFPNENGEPYKSSGGEMVESELGLIPKGWKVTKIGDVTKIVRGASPRPIQSYLSNTGMPWVKISDASESNTKYIYKTKEFIKNEGISKSRVVLPGTLILSNSATPGIPKFMLIKACVHDGWLIFNDYKDISKEYLYYCLIREREGVLSLSNGSVFRNLKTDILKNYKIIIPDNKVLNKIQNYFFTTNKEIEKRTIENEVLKNIRDTLLPKLMSGEIRVPVEEEK